ncbi:DUF4263 domain-containing protein [Candidatus Poribacteria bacterium]|nr:DUF4263 domain-containing protein [Candidatus Poribacteria bacterium]
MKTFIKFNFDPKLCRRELDEFKELLDSRSTLDERRDILPFFRKRKHLSAFIGSYFSYQIYNFDRLAFEYSLFGDFSCDWVVGDFAKGGYCFIEFEDATPTSIFEPKGKKATLEWSSRFERGFSQIVDWFWKLDDMKGSIAFKSQFGRDYIRYNGMLILGRSKDLDYKEQMRLQWRLDKVLVDSMQIFCITFDELYKDLDSHLSHYGPLT